MHFFARAVVTGFALALGAALFKKVSKQLGLDDPPEKSVEQVEQGAAAPQTT